MKTKSVFSILSFVLLASLQVNAAGTSPFGELQAGTFNLIQAGGWWCPDTVKVQITGATVVITDFATFAKIGPSKEATPYIDSETLAQKTRSKSYFDATKKELVRLEEQETKAQNTPGSSAPPKTNSRSFIAVGDSGGLELKTLVRGKVTRVCRYMKED